MKKLISSVVLVSGLFTTNIFADINLSDGLVAHYEFEGDANDSSGNGNNGTQYGGVEYVDGVIGKAVSFDNNKNDNNQYINLGHYNEFDVNYISENITLSAFIKTTDDNATIFSDNTTSGWYYFMIYENKLSLMYRNTSWDWDNRIKSNLYISDGKWHHVLGIIDGYTFKLYIDGQFDTEKTFYDSKLSWSGTFSGVSIGAVGYKENDTGKPERSDWYNDGLIDDLRIYNRALNEDEIKALYKLGCSDEIIYAKSPITNRWFQFPSKCDAPADWETNTTVPVDYTTLQEVNTTKVSSITTDKLDNLSNGWHLLGTSSSIQNLDIFNNTKFIWKYNDINNSWRAYSPDSAKKALIQNHGFDSFDSIEADEGFWIYK